MKRLHPMLMAIPLLVVVVLTETSLFADLLWDAGGDMYSVYDEANWFDTDTNQDPTNGTVDALTPVLFNLIVSGNSFVGGAGGIGNEFVIGDGFSITLNDSSEWRHYAANESNNSPLVGTPDGETEKFTLNDQSKAFFQFVSRIELTLNDESEVTFRGTNNPVSKTNVILNSFSTKVFFLNESVQEFLDEHVEKFHVFEDPATLSVNILAFEIVVDGESITVVEPLPQPIVIGDVNRDGSVNLLDVAPFVDSITDSTDYIPEADINLDGQNDLFDVSPFVSLLTGS